MKGDKSGLDSTSRWHRVLLLIGQRFNRGAFGNEPLAAIEHHHHKNDAEDQFDRLHEIKLLQKDNASQIAERVNPLRQVLQKP